ncbi:class I SAM-dependent methyltransferase [Alkalicoccobacillus murimartini]|uniref:Methyltransferase n=1 Tax=Alkalicoccobacillus murimartini TaxID=171685 RepID=A0ABT9YK32_9BACI|nr:class I SAM-dependent methyltransferase [Alkalicoccobacillus murimartini]MDQ0208202.1 putative methyltransferase [Alkalicoccobacillus murimartini]
MKLKGILPFARELLDHAITEGDTAVDATAGNGHDTCYLAKLVGQKGRVYSFDVQEAAVEATKARLHKEELLERVDLHHTGHEHAVEMIQPEHLPTLKAAIFNLGYLPGSDKSITTHAETTIKAISGLFHAMTAEGIIVLVVYHGHAEGAIEKEAILDYVRQLPQEKAHVLQYGFVNQKNAPPFIVAIEKR